jgi:hypothetical protein
MLSKVLVSILAAAVLAPAACGAATRFTLSIYDPSGEATTRLTMTDVVRSSARAASVEGRSAALYVRLTRVGAQKFHTLTRDLARRGARLHRPQVFVFQINSHVYARPVIDYRVYPNGIEGDGLQIDGLRLATARRLASQIRTG